MGFQYIISKFSVRLLSECREHTTLYTKPFCPPAHSPGRATATIVHCSYSYPWRIEELKKKAKSKAQKMVVSSKSKAKKNKAKDALPPRAVVADKGSAGEKSEYILRRARVVPQRVRGRRLSFTFFLPLLFMMLRSLDLLSLCQGDGSCLFHSLQHGLNRLELYSGDARSLRRDTSDFLRTHRCLEIFRHEYIQYHVCRRGQQQKRRIKRLVPRLKSYTYIDVGQK